MTTEAHDLSVPQPSHPAQARGRVGAGRLAGDLLPFTLAFVVFLAAFFHMRPEPTGDEPHYLIAAQSLAFDGDFDLTNDYASRDRTLRVASSFPLDTFWQAADYKENGKLRPVHAGGLAVILAAPTGLWGLTGARLAMVLIAALLADQLYRLLRDLRFRRPWRLLAWIATVFCLPLLVFTSQVYTEIPGALLVVVLARLIVARAPSTAALALGSAACAGLVWLHVRFLPLAVGAMFGLALAASDRLIGHAAGPRGWLAWIKNTMLSLLRLGIREWRTFTVPLLGPFIVGVGGLMVAFKYLYGSFSFNAGYAVWGDDVNIGRAGWNFIYEFVVTDFFNPVQGWIPFAPVHWLGLAAIGLLILRFGWPAVGALAVIAAFELAGASVGPNAGWQLPARLLMPVIPLIAIPLAAMLQAVRVSRVIFIPLLALSLVYGFAGVERYQGLLPVGVKPRIFGASETAFLFPITRDLNLSRLTTSFRISPGWPEPQTGRVDGGRITAQARRDPRGFLIWGPYSSLKEGSYKATFPLAVTGAAPNDHVAAIEVAGTPPSTFFARRELKASQLRRQLTDQTMAFNTPGGYLVEARVFFLGKGTLSAGEVEVTPVRIAQDRFDRISDWALVLIWVGGTILLGLVFVALAKRSEWSTTRSNQGE
jgi:hypothetical protein